MVYVDDFTFDDLEYNIIKKYDYHGKQRREYINIECAFDIETTSTYVNGEKFAFMYEWTFGLKDGTHICYGRTWDEFFNLCEKLRQHFQLSSCRILVCYIHNQGFEFQFMRKYCEWISVFATDDRKPIKALSEYGIEFRDSLILSGYSLAKLAENLTSHKIQKLVGDLDYDLIRTKDTVLTKKELDYCNNDVEIILAYISEQIEQCGDITKIPLTNTGRVRKFVRDKCLYTKKSHKKSDSGKFYRYRALMKELSLNTFQYLMLKKCFMGGYTHASLLYSGKTLHNVDSIDFTSSYPYVMLSEKFPMSKPLLVNLKEENVQKLIDSDKWGLMFEIEFTNLRSKLTYESYLSESKCDVLENPTINNGRVYKADKVKTVITDIDYKIMCENYSWDKAEISICYKFYMEYLPKSIILAILELYGKKTTLKNVVGKEAEYLLGKGMLNSVYGMAVTDIVRNEIVYDEETDTWVSVLANKEMFDKEIEKYNKDVKRFLYYPWGVWVTAYARRNLWSGILAFGDDYVYSDTDSIKCLNIEKHREFINNYNSEVEQKLKAMCEFRKVDYSLCKPKTIKGVEKLIGVWDWETKGNQYKTFKTLGAKRYMYCDNDGLHITIAGLSKQNGVKYIMQQSNDNIDECFNFFNNDMYIPPEHTGKMTHTYIDDEMETDITDYQGHTTHVVAKSSIHLEKCDFTLSISKKYAEFLRQLLLGNVYKGTKGSLV